MRTFTPVLFTAVATLSLAAALRADMPAAQPPAAVHLEDDNQKRADEVPVLRQYRKQLESIRGDLNKDATDPKGYRHETVAALDKAIGLIDQEINEYKTDNGK